MKCDLTAAGFVLLLILGVSVAASAGPAADGDTDGVYNVLDNCLTIANGAGLDCDQDNDGYGNRCDCDYDNDFDCDVTDFNQFRSEFGNVNLTNEADSNCDGDVTITDFNNFRSGFNYPIGGVAGTLSSGLHCAGTVPCDL